MDKAGFQLLLDEGERFLQVGDNAAAERTFRLAVASASDSPIARSKLGVALAQQGRLDDAIAEFTKAVAMTPAYAPAFSNLGNAYRERGRLAEALAAYERALAIDPEYWVAHQNLGVLYKQMGRLGEAVEHFKKATKMSVRQPPGTARRRGCLAAPAVMVVGAVLIATLVWHAP
jgi:tetratricopeptide (TPR) repeat protein